MQPNRLPDGLDLGVHLLAMTPRPAQQLALCLTTLWLCSLALADNKTIYRVDVVVFSHLTGEADERFAPTPVDFGDYLDPNANSRAAAWTTRPDAEELSDEERSRRDALATLDQLRALENSGRSAEGRFRGGPLFPIEWSGMDAMTPAMTSAWERLSTSGRHQPLVWRSWYQSLEANDRGRWIRLHGGGLMALDWLAQEVGDPEYLENFDPGPYPFLLSRSKHELDGIVRLRQRQFLHVDLDLTWQQPVAAAPFVLKEPWHDPEGVLMHKFAQSRSVRPGRIEYFDSSWLGVLVRVEEWRSPAVAEASAEPAR